MALSEDTLATELKAIGLYDNEPEALADWADAFTNYFADAQSNGVIILPAALPAAEAAFIGAGTGLSTGAAAALTAAITAFWGALVPGAAWLTVTAIAPPPGLSGLAAALAPVFQANIIGKKTADESMEAIATVIHNIVAPTPPVPPAIGLATWPSPLGPQPIF